MQRGIILRSESKLTRNRITNQINATFILRRTMIERTQNVHCAIGIHQVTQAFSTNTFFATAHIRSHGFSQTSGQRPPNTRTREWTLENSNTIGLGFRRMCGHALFSEKRNINQRATTLL